MVALVRQLFLVLAVVFATLQTGAGCARPPLHTADVDDCDDEEEDEHHDEPCADDEGPCAPTCFDCPGCAGPCSALIGGRAALGPLQVHPVVLHAFVQRMRSTTDTPRVERPPRALG